jgi:hypothetical protein
MKYTSLTFFFNFSTNSFSPPFVVFCSFSFPAFFSFSTATLVVDGGGGGGGGGGGLGGDDGGSRDDDIFHTHKRIE